MTVRATPPPAVDRMVRELDLGARATVNLARTHATPVIRAVFPVQSGKLRRGITGRVGRTATGYRLEFAATSRVRYRSGVSAREVLRFVTRGTGVYGRGGRPIRPRRRKAFSLPNGWVGETVRGQRGHPYMTMAQYAADGSIVRTFQAGVVNATAAAERAA